MAATTSSPQTGWKAAEFDLEGTDRRHHRLAEVCGPKPSPATLVPRLPAASARRMAHSAAGHPLRFAMATRASGWTKSQFRCYIELGCAIGGRSVAFEVRYLAKAGSHGLAEAIGLLIIKGDTDGPVRYVPPNITQCRLA